jgi:quinol-cytochrome oxidoreductase complex cytochrome b subunit
MTTRGTKQRAMSDTKFSNQVIRWIDHRLPIFTFLHHELHEYPTPRNLNYLWSFGSLAGIVLVIMILTGIVLAMHYVPTFAGAFKSVEHIMRDVNYGWLIRYVHTTGASMFFAVVYIHIFRGLYYGSYKAPRELLWILGVLILVLMMATAFFGYTLPWGQMSFWGATAITNLFSAIPIIGDSIVTWLLGGFGVGDQTLNRFYALHYLLPFVIIEIVVLHLVAQHRFGSNNPDGIDTEKPQDTVAFHPYYTIKDIFGLAVFLIVFGWFVFYEPSALLNSDNSIPANPGTTPAHIVVPPAVLRHPEIHSEQTSWRVGHGCVNFGIVPGTMARDQPSSLGAIQTSVPGVLLDSGDRLHSAHLCGRTTTRGSLAIGKPIRGRILFPAFPGRPAACRTARNTEAAAV